MNQGVASAPTIATIGPPDTTTELDYFGGATGAEHYKDLCSRGYADPFSKAYCAGATPPVITSMVDLLTLLGMRKDGSLTSNTFHAFNSQNASVVSRDTSVLNPRAILFQPTSPFLALGFTRGSNLVEIAAQDFKTWDINFFLLRYQRACDLARTCTNGDRFLPANESGWQSVDVYSGHEDLRNRPHQCDTCHRPAGFNYTTNTGAIAILRQQQLIEPWTAWLRNSQRTGGGRHGLSWREPGGEAPLTAAFCSTHINEDYAGVPYSAICPNPESANGGPEQLEKLLIEPNNYQDDPHVIVYQGFFINNDDYDFAGPPNLFYLDLFATMLAGKIIHLPYYKINAFDDIKVSAASMTYQAVATGMLPPGATPDLAAAALLAAEALPFIGHVGITTNPVTGEPATAPEVVNQMCSTCHQGLFPGSGNRENFQVSDFPDHLTAVERIQVANRICRPQTSQYLMPPAMFGDLSADNKALILSTLGLDPKCPTE